jgi:REP element-mobilizing transposase RayT
MSMFNGHYRIESARLPGWDYTLGWYFITVCTYQRRRSLSTVVGDKARLSPIGAIVAEEWQRTVVVRPNVTIDAWVVMPDHFHGIIAIHDVADGADRAAVDGRTMGRADGVDDIGGADRAAVDGRTMGRADGVETPRRGVSTMTTPSASSSPTASSSPSAPSARPSRPSVLPAGSLGAIVGQWKSVATKRARTAGYIDFAWQSRFYDVIIRDERGLDAIRRYIANNPRGWTADRERRAGVWM